MVSPSSGQVPRQPPAPLVPVALAVGVGIFLERHLTLPVELLLALLVACIISWLLSLRDSLSLLPSYSGVLQDAFLPVGIASR